MLLLIFDTQDDCDKFMEIYEKYKKIIYYTIKRFVVSDEYAVEDISQEIYIILANPLDSIDLNDYSRARNYIITVTRNYCKNYIRNNSKFEEYPLSELSSSYTFSDTIIDNLSLNEQLTFLINEIKNLDDKYRSVLELKYANDFTDEEIAQFLKINKKTVQMRLYRSKIMLRRKLGEKYNE